MEVLTAIIVGLMLGSFLSVLVGRWDTRKGILTGRSACPDCGHALAWYDLIPLVSWIVLFRCCRYCRRPIPFRYPAMELAMGSVFGVYAARWGVSGWWSVGDFAMLFGFVVLFFFDVYRRILPDAVVFPLIGIALARLIVLRPDFLANSVATGSVLAAGLFLLHAVSHGRWLGMGDVKLSFLVGVLFGYPAAVSVTFIAIWLGALFGLVLMAVRRAALTTALPFGAFWSAVAIIAVLWPTPVRMLSGLFMPTLR
jgi:leader peptidase (prepilin peptidase)/N-methyltransferase